MAQHWQPQAPRVSGLVRPVALDPDGLSGPTRGQVRGPGWVQTTRGRYVPAGTQRSGVEQRILEQSMRLTGTGVVTGWAALRLLGGGFFDGLARDGVTQLPVPLAAGSGRIAPHPEIDLSRVVVDPTEVVRRHGISCADVHPALFAAMASALRRGEDREAVVAMDMAAAAELTSIHRMRAWIDARPRHRDNDVVRRVLDLASEDSRSPQETRFRLLWVLDAGWPPPICNRRVLDGRGVFLGKPDLIDPETGVTGEFEGADHRGRERHRKDVRREDALRRAGLEPVTVVGADLDDIPLVVERLEAARRRALGRLCGWVLAQPGESLDDRLDHRDLMRELAELHE